MIAGEIEQRSDGFYYVGKSGNWFRIKVWVGGDRFCIATDDFKEQYSVAGELKGIAQVPVHSKTHQNGNPGD